MEILAELAGMAVAWAAPAAAGAFVTWLVGRILQNMSERWQRRRSKEVTAGLEKAPTGLTIADFPFEGKWDYKVTDNDDDYYHSGHCQITALPNRMLKFDGVRTLTVEHGRRIEKSTAWDSLWAERCGDNKVRGEYTIHFDDVVIGYFCLNSFETTVENGAPRYKMGGQYFWLSPRRKFGYITYTR